MDLQNKNLLASSPIESPKIFHQAFERHLSIPSPLPTDPSPNRSPSQPTDRRIPHHSAFVVCFILFVLASADGALVPVAPQCGNPRSLPPALCLSPHSPFLPDATP
eukprot:TRINITY_DN848_c0_g1_i1.p7 TRINITY_DN848_c0_g1~~TRINITY_DN848_c0_g1_i1.p7  ORF type:complete len:106 (-),score=6.36 TRINITY_DN848_c0_g1_i1:946-1263(-)